MKYTLKIKDNVSGEERIHETASFAKAVKLLKDELEFFVATGCTRNVTLSIWDKERQDFVRYITYINA